MLTALACTGLRISELAALRWSDIDGENNLIRLTDESTRGRRRKGQPARQTKPRLTTKQRRGTAKSATWSRP